MGRLLDRGGRFRVVPATQADHRRDQWLADLAGPAGTRRTGSVRDRGDTVRLTALAVAGVAALALGLVMLRGSEIGFDPGGALAGIASQVPVTLPATLLVLAATSANLL